MFFICQDKQDFVKINLCKSAKKHKNNNTDEESSGSVPGTDLLSGTSHLHLMSQFKT